MLTLLAKLLKAFNSDDNPAQIALAVVLAAFMGLTPLAMPHNLLILLLVLVLRVNLSMFLLSFGLFTLTAYVFDPVSHLVGLALLQSDALTPFWTSLYNNSFWRFMAYNNSLVLGSLVICIALSPFIFFTTRSLVVKYREYLMAMINKSRLMLWLKGSKFYSVYDSIKN